MSHSPPPVERDPSAEDQLGLIEPPRRENAGDEINEADVDEDSSEEIDGAAS